jgi:hypothetical protein
MILNCLFVTDFCFFVAKEQKALLIVSSAIFYLPMPKLSAGGQNRERFYDEKIFIYNRD